MIQFELDIGIPRLAIPLYSNDFRQLFGALRYYITPQVSNTPSVVMRCVRFYDSHRKSRLSYSRQRIPGSRLKTCFWLKNVIFIPLLKDS